MEPAHKILDEYYKPLKEIDGIGLICLELAMKEYAGQAVKEFAKGCSMAGKSEIENFINELK